MMDRTVLILDLETESYNKGAWTDPRNFVIAIGYQIGDGPIFTVVPSEEELRDLQHCIYACDVLVLFNAKFDMHWLVNMGIDLTGVKVYDLQLADFIVNGMTNQYPSLDDMAFRYLSERKLDFVKLEYWDKGKLTSEVPLDKLMEYLHQDVALTKKLFEMDIVPERQMALFKLSCEDLLVLFEMERNGVRYDREKSLALAAEAKSKVQGLFDKHFSVHGIPDFNWGSPDQLAALLFGGTITRRRQVPVGHYKSGAKAGQVKFKWEDYDVQFPRRYAPVGRTASGKWSTDDDTLSKLGSDDLISDLKTIRALQKEVNTYLEGLPNKQTAGGYSHHYIYTNFNQCVTDTGRLSSTNPNCQNLSEAAQSCCITRYE